MREQTDAPGAIPSSTRRLLAGLALILLAMAIVTRSWLAHNDLPDGYQNEFIHLYNLTQIYFPIRDGRAGDAHYFLWQEYYPPLLMLWASFCMALFGLSKNVAVLSLLVFLGLLLYAVGRITAKLADPTTAMVAALLLALSPAIYGNIRRFEPNIALAGMVAAAGTFLLLRGPPRTWRAGLGFGLLCGLGMLADRLVFAVYLAPMLLVAFRQERRWRPWLTALLSATALCGYYYFWFLQLHLAEITSQIGGEITDTGELSALSPISSPLFWLYYPLSLFDTLQGGVLASASLVGLGLYMRRGRRHLKAESRALLEAWLFGGLLIITLIGKKQPFYAIPLLAPLSVVAALGWRTLRAPRLRLGVALTVLCCGVLQLVALTWRPDPERRSLLAGRSPLPALLLGEAYPQARAPRNLELRVEEMARLCERGATGSGKVLLFSEAHEVYEGQLLPTLRLAMGQLEVTGALMELPAFAGRIFDASCFVYVTHSDRRWPSARSFTGALEQYAHMEPSASLLKQLAATEARAKPLGSWRTRLGDAVHVYRLVAVPHARGDGRLRERLREPTRE